MVLKIFLYCSANVTPSFPSNSNSVHDFSLTTKENKEATFSEQEKIKKARNLHDINCKQINYQISSNPSVQANHT